MDDKRFWEEASSICERIGRTLAIRHQLEVEEVVSHLLLEMVENKALFLPLLREGEEALIIYRLKKVFKDWQAREECRLMAETGNVFYDARYVKLALIYYYDWVNGDFQANQQFVPTLVDIQQALPYVNDSYRLILQTRHHTHTPTNGESVDWTEIAGVTGRKNDQAAQRAYLRAVDALVLCMNQTYYANQRASGVGRRRVMSNAKMSAVTSRQTEQ